MAQRNNIASLPQKTRFKIYAMMLDGMGYDAIRAEVKALGVNCKLHGSTFIAVRKSAEYLRFRDETCKWQSETAADALRAAVIRANDTDATAIAEAELMTQLQSMINISESTKDVKALTGALKDLAAIKETRKIQALEKQIELLKIEHANELSERDAAIDDLRSKNAALLNAGDRKALSEEAIRMIEEQGGIL